MDLVGSSTSDEVVPVLICQIISPFFIYFHAV
jgi:hypothetical protein